MPFSVNLSRYICTYIYYYHYYVFFFIILGALLLYLFSNFRTNFCILIPCGVSFCSFKTFLYLLCCSSCLVFSECFWEQLFKVRDRHAKWSREGRGERVEVSESVIVSSISIVFFFKMRFRIWAYQVPFSGARLDFLFLAHWICHLWIMFTICQ